MKAKTRGERRSPSDETAAAGIVMVALEQLANSALNPRKTFDSAALEELAASIVADGLLQNLVVRPRPADSIRPAKGDRPAYEIVAGERRWRALSLLWERDQWDAGAANIPCRVVEADDTQARAIALLENLQRQEISPIEEGEAFRALRDLDPECWSTAAIAERIRRTQRYVQQRLALVTKLEPELQAAIADGRLRIEQARFLTAAPAEIQQEVLARLDSPYWSHPDQIRAQVVGGMIPASRAAFPLDQYRGNRVELEEGGEVWLADREEFMRLQKQAAKAQVAALRKEWHWAKLVEGWFSSWEYAPGRSKDRKAAGAVVVLGHDGKLEVKTGLVKKQEEARVEARVAERHAAMEREREAEQQFQAELAEALKRQPVEELLRVLLASFDHWDLAKRLQLSDSGSDPADIWDALAALQAPAVIDLAATMAARDAAPSGWPPSQQAAAAIAARYGVWLPEHLRPPPDGEDAVEEEAA